MPPKPPKLAVIVSGQSRALLRSFLAGYVKLPFGMHRSQWRKRYRDEYGLVVLSRPLEDGGDAQALYDPHEACAALVLAAGTGSGPGSGPGLTRAWLKARGYAPVAELRIRPGLSESEKIDLGAEIVNFINVRCPWRNEQVQDIDAYLEKNNKPFWA